MTVIEAFRELRRESGMSLEKMSRVYDVSFKTIHRFENDMPARGKWLIRFAALARRCRRPDLAQIFCLAFCEQNELSAESLSWLMEWAADPVSA